MFEFGDSTCRKELTDTAKRASQVVFLCESSNEESFYSAVTDTFPACAPHNDATNTTTDYMLMQGRLFYPIYKPAPKTYTCNEPSG